MALGLSVPWPSCTGEGALLLVLSPAPCVWTGTSRVGAYGSQTVRDGLAPMLLSDQEFDRCRGQACLPACLVCAHAAFYGWSLCTKVYCLGTGAGALVTWEIVLL